MLLILKLATGTKQPIAESRRLTIISERRKLLAPKINDFNVLIDLTL